MSAVGFEPTISVFERTKTVHALDSAADVIGPQRVYRPYISDAKLQQKAETGRKAINIRDSIYIYEREME
jgi:hypothetical protein